MRRHVLKTMNEDPARYEGVALVDAQSAARLLKESGVLESARKNMVFYKVVTSSPTVERKAVRTYRPRVPSLHSK
jgi:hypothetical protein